MVILGVGKGVGFEVFWLASRGSLSEEDQRGGARVGRGECGVEKAATRACAPGGGMPRLATRARRQGRQGAHMGPWRLENFTWLHGMACVMAGVEGMHEGLPKEGPRRAGWGNGQDQGQVARVSAVLQALLAVGGT